MRIPHRLAVVMGVDVDEAGCDRQAACVDFVGGRANDAADRRDLAVGHGDVSLERRAAIAVHDGAAADDEIEIMGHGSFPCYRMVALSADAVEWASLGAA